VGGITCTRTQVVLVHLFISRAMATEPEGADTAPVASLNLSDAKNIEQYMEICFLMQNMGNAEVIKLGMGQGAGFLAEFNVHLGTNNAIGKPVSDFPRMVRVHLHAIPNGVYEVEPASLAQDLCSDTHFTNVLRGTIATTTTLDLFMHACENGLNIHYNSRLFPKAVYNATVGGSRIITVPANIAGVELPIQLARAERYAFMCFQRAGQLGTIIDMGTGEHGGHSLFVDLVLINPPPPSHIPRAYRIFLQASAEVLNQIPVELRRTKETNEEFRYVKKGDVLLPGLIDIHVHVCALGVAVRFRKTDGVGGVMMYKVGPSWARLNPH